MMGKALTGKVFLEGGVAKEEKSCFLVSAIKCIIFNRKKNFFCVLCFSNPYKMASLVTRLVLRKIIFLWQVHCSVVTASWLFLYLAIKFFEGMLVIWRI